MKDALKLAPMELCIYSGRNIREIALRDQWRHGWAAGFLGRSLTDYLSVVTHKRSKDAFRQGFLLGEKARNEFDSCRTL